jgi:hypothetical protein
MSRPSDAKGWRVITRRHVHPGEALRGALARPRDLQLAPDPGDEHGERCASRRHSAAAPKGTLKRLHQTTTLRLVTGERLTLLRPGARSTATFSVTVDRAAR